MPAPNLCIIHCSQRNQEGEGEVQFLIEKILMGRTTPVSGTDSSRKIRTLPRRKENRPSGDVLRLALR